MNKWKHTIDLSRVWLREDNTKYDNEDVHKLGKYISEVLNTFIKSKGYEEDYKIEEIVEYFYSVFTEEQADEINEDNENNGEDWWEIVPLEEFDESMRCLYDWADSENIWVKTN
jgi:hypothetical protein